MPNKIVWFGVNVPIYKETAHELSDAPYCIHCKSVDVRPSRMHPHRFAGINFTEYFRCRKCGRHFAIVSYTQILAAGGTVVLVLTFITAGFIYTVSQIH